MLNVNIEERHLEKIFADGFLFEHGKNELTIRNGDGKTLAELIYFEETNNILIMEESGFVWCKRVTDMVSIDDNEILIFYDFMHESLQHTCIGIKACKQHGE